MDPQTEMNRRLAQSVRARGWRTGLEARHEQCGEAEYHRSRSQLSMRHTAWKVFFDPRHRGTVLAVDRGWGSALISVAADFERVIAIFTDQESLDLAQARLSWLGIGNVEFVFARRLDSVELPPGSLDAAALYGVPVSEVTPAFCGLLAGWLRSHATAYFGLPRMGARLWRLRHLLEWQFSRIRTFRYDMPLNEGYELGSLDEKPEALRGRLVNLLAQFRAPAFGIAAVKTNAAQTVFDPIVERVAPDARIQRFLMSYPFGLSLMTVERKTGARALIKIPLDPAAVSRAEVNYRLLNALQPWNGIGGASFPKPLQCDRVGGQPFFVEEVLRGRVIRKRDLNDRGPTGIRANALAWITGFHEVTAQPSELRGALLETLVLVPVDRACRSLKADGELLEAMREYLADAFGGQRLNLVFSHGDYTTDNLLLDQSRNSVRGVFDWDLADEKGLPLLDVFYFLAAAERDRNGTSYGSIFARLFRRNVSGEDRAIVERYCAALDVPPALVTPLAVMTWIYHLVNRMHMTEPGSFPTSLWKETLQELSILIAARRKAPQWQK
jgi:hypothetical protein